MHLGRRRQSLLRDRRSDRSSDRRSPPVRTAGRGIRRDSAMPLLLWRGAGRCGSRGVALPVALVAALALLITLAALASRTSSGFFSSVFQGVNREARDVAESAINDFANTLNREENRGLWVAGNDQKSAWSSNDDLKNPCTQWTPVESSDLVGAYAETVANPSATTASNFAESTSWIALPGGDASQEYRVEDITYRYENRTGASSVRQNYNFADNNVNIPGITVRNSALQGGTRTLARVTIQGRVTRNGQTSVARVTREFEVVPKCCKRSFGSNTFGGLGGIDAGSTDTWGADTGDCPVYKDDGLGRGIIGSLDGGAPNGSNNTLDIRDENNELVTQAICWAGNDSSEPSDLDGTPNQACVDGDQSLGKASKTKPGVSFRPLEFSLQLPDPFFRLPSLGASGVVRRVTGVSYPQFQTALTESFASGDFVGVFNYDLSCGYAVAEVLNRNAFRFDTGFADPGCFSAPLFAVKDFLDYQAGDAQSDSNFSTYGNILFDQNTQNWIINRWNGSRSAVGAVLNGVDAEGLPWGRSNYINYDPLSRVCKNSQVLSQGCLAPVHPQEGLNNNLNWDLVVSGDAIIYLALKSGLNEQMPRMFIKEAGGVSKALNNCTVSRAPGDPYYVADCYFRSIATGNTTLKIDTTYAMINFYFDPDYDGFYMGGQTGNTQFLRVQCDWEPSSVVDDGCDEVLDWDDFQLKCDAASGSDGRCDDANITNPNFDRSQLFNVFTLGDGKFNIKGTSSTVGMNIYAPFADVTLIGGGNADPNFMGRIWTNNIYLNGNVKVRVPRSMPSFCGGLSCPPPGKVYLYDMVGRSYSHASGFGFSQ